MKLAINYIKKIYSYLDFKLGRILFKNDNNFLINFIGLVKLNKKIINFTQNENSLNLIKDGFTKIDIFDEKDLKYFSDKIKDFAKNNSDKPRLDIDVDERIIKKTNELLTKNKSLISSLNGYFKANFIIAEINIYRNKHFIKNENKELINENFHCDHYKKTMVKLFINLDEVKIENGPLEIFTKKNTKKMIDNGYINRNNYGNSNKLIEERKNKYLNTGPAGNALLCATTECLHRASIPDEGYHRDIMAVTLFKDFSKNFNPIKYEKEINKNLAKKIGKLNFT
tara:strand:+ start:899 stop:1747 length:849 start_codon:yes stop_codon:yes gene_type:complete